MRRLWPLTARGTGAVLLGFACLIAAGELGVGELVYVGVLLFALVAGALLTLFVVRRTEGITRSMDPDVLSVGGEGRVTVRVGMRAALPSAPGTWRDTLSPGLSASGSGSASGVFPSLDSGLRGTGHTIDFSYSVKGVRRGIPSIGPLSVSSTDPFGLVRRTHVLGERTRVTVAPEIVDLPTFVEQPGEAGGMRHTSTNQLGQGADNLVPRAYFPGDSMRRIHWRASAHRDQLMVRQEEQESTPSATVVLDLSTRRFTADAMRAPGSDPGFERAITAAVSAVARLVREGFSVALIDSDGSPLGAPVEGGDVPAVETLAGGLATMVSRRDDHLVGLVPLFSGDAAGPLVVVVGAFDETDAASLAAVAHHSSLPILLSVAPVGDALGRAAESSWHVAGIGVDVDLASAWQSAIERGAQRVAR